MLSPKGRLIGDFTVARLAAERFQLTASYAAQAFHMRWFAARLPPSGVSVRNVSLERVGFQIAGPRARDVLAAATSADVSNEALRFFDAREIEVGLVPALVCRVSYTGDLGYEIYVDSEHQIALWQALAAAGEAHGMKLFGMRAMMSLRLEKSFGAWMREYRPDYTPAETGLDRFVDLRKNDFIGRDAAMRERDAPPGRRLCTFVVDARDADVWADEPIFAGDDVVGFVTSGGYAHYSRKSVALGFVPVETMDGDTEFAIEILGERRAAKLVGEPVLDPQASACGADVDGRTPRDSPRIGGVTRTGSRPVDHLPGCPCPLPRRRSIARKGDSVRSESSAFCMTCHSGIAAPGSRVRSELAGSRAPVPNRVTPGAANFSNSP